MKLRGRVFKEPDLQGRMQRLASGAMQTFGHARKGTRVRIDASRLAITCGNL
ncbi:MAG: hypothetical protein L0229_22040 [Blastocatellia bacterium]|nr:hypothetical protein [Blastocatellia bacterium]